MIRKRKEKEGLKESSITLQGFQPTWEFRERGTIRPFLGGPSKKSPTTLKTRFELYTAQTSSLPIPHFTRCRAWDRSSMGGRFGQSTSLGQEQPRLQVSVNRH